MTPVSLTVTNRPVGMANDQDVFTKIYQTERWGKRLGSGSGSLPENTRPYRTFLEGFLRESGVRSVADLGCGDWQSSCLVDWGSIDYHGIDVVESIVAQNTRLYGSRTVRFSIRSPDHPLPPAELVIIKDVFIHLPNDRISEILRAVTYTYDLALITETSQIYDITDGRPIGPEVNGAIEMGDMRPVNLRLSPFGLTAPVVHAYASPRPTIRGEEIKQTLLGVFSDRVPNQAPWLKSRRFECQYPYRSAGERRGESRAGVPYHLRYAPEST